MTDIALVFALFVAAGALLYRRHFIYGLLALVLAGYLFSPDFMETLASHWFRIAASKGAAEVLFYLMIAVIVIAFVGRSRYNRR